MDYYLAKFCGKGIRRHSIMDLLETPIVDTNTTPPRSPFSMATATPRNQKHLSYMSPSFDVYRQSPVDPTRTPPPISSDDEDEQEQDHYSYMVSLKQSLAASSVHLQSSVLDPRDKETSDEWVPRNPSLIRLTGKHPFNCEPPLDVLMRHGFITPAPLHYVRNHGHVPKATWDKWMVEVSGLVRRETCLTMADLVVGSFPQSEFPVTITCSGNRRKEQNMVKKTVGFNWGPGAISTSIWRGIRLRDVLISCGVKRKHGLHVWLEGEEDLPAGGGTKYATSITLEVALDPSRDIMLVFMMNGDWLPPDHGYPVRMIVPGYTGGRMVKWLRRIIVTDKENDSHYHYKDNRVLPPNVVNAEIADAEGWWYKPEYVINEINTNSVITSPSHDEIVRINSPKPYTMKGYAYSGGGKKVTRVEVTFDGGETWRACNVDYPEKPNEYGKYWCWCFWSLDVEVLDLVGAKEVAVRAWDQSHSTQPSKMIWNLMGMMNNSWYRLKVSICRPRKGEIGLVFEQPVLPGNATGGWMDKQKHMESCEYEGMKKSVSTPSMDIPRIQKYTISEVRKHCTKESAWIIVHDNIYDCTPFLNDHPGGADSILINAGIDCTEEFDAIHSDKAKAMLGKYHIGEIIETANTPDSPNNSLANLLQFESVVKDVPVTASSTSNIPQALIPREKVPCKLVMKTSLSHNVRLFRFALPTEKHVLGLPVGKHIYVCATIEDKLCMRAYTPTSKADEVGHFDLLVKIYFKNVAPKFPKGGLMSQHLESLSIGDTVDVKGPLGHIEYTGRGNFTIHNRLKSAKKLAMIAGGTGITPIYQVMQAALSDPEDETEMWVVCVNRSEEDVLLKEELDSWVEKYGDRVKVWHVIKESRKDGWPYTVGSLSEDVLREHVPVWSEGTLALACGPPGLIQHVVQPSLQKMGYDSKESLLVF